MFCRTRRLQKFFFCSQMQLVMQFPVKQTWPAAQLAMHFPAEKNLICSTRFECLISCWLTWISVRTGGRLDKSDVITKPKFLALLGLPKSLSYRAPPRAPTAHARAPLLSARKLRRRGPCHPYLCDVKASFNLFIKPGLNLWRPYCLHVVDSGVPFTNGNVAILTR